jgi:hypothetical protein
VNNNIYFDLNTLFANPAKRAKTGHGFLMIPYEYLYAIIGAHLGACELSVFLYILRETYGKKNMWKIQNLCRYKHHPVNYISTKDIIRYTGYSQSRVSVALNRLENDYGMIVILEEAKKGRGWKIELQPDIGKWNIGETGKQRALEYHRNPKGSDGKEADEASVMEAVAVEAEVQRKEKEDDESLLVELSTM